MFNVDETTRERVLSSSQSLYPAMKTRRQLASENALTVSRRDTPSPTSETIPIDQIIEILLRLPAKSIGRCRCVSKHWSSTLVGPYFTELFLTRSFARPRLLFSFRDHGDNLLFSSAPQVRNPDEKSCIVAANHHMKIPCHYEFEPRGAVRGLVCVKGRKTNEVVICNPSTGQSLPLPKVKTNSTEVGDVKSILGFDPIDKQFKVLSMTLKVTELASKEHQVLTLGTKKPSWRMVESSVAHYFPGSIDAICIDGRLYYVAVVTNPKRVLIIWFDVRSEKFGLINIPDDMLLWCNSTLVNYKGKLAVFLSGVGYPLVNRDTTGLELWVLEDAERHEWSKQHISVLPPLWKNVVGESQLNFVGLIGTDEIMLSPPHFNKLFYVLYYNIEKNTIEEL